MRVLDIIIGVYIVYILSDFCLLYEFLYPCTEFEFSICGNFMFSTFYLTFFVFK